MTTQLVTMVNRFSLFKPCLHSLPSIFGGNYLHNREKSSSLFVLEQVIPNLFYLHITSHQNLNSQTPALNNLLPVSILPLQRRVHLLCPPKIHIVSFHFIMYIYEKKSLNNFSSCCNGYF